MYLSEEIRHNCTYPQLRQCTREIKRLGFIECIDYQTIRSPKEEVLLYLILALSCSALSLTRAGNPTYCLPRVHGYKGAREIYRGQRVEMFCKLYLKNTSERSFVVAGYSSRRFLAEMCRQTT